MQIKQTKSFERELKKLVKKHFPITVLKPCLKAIVEQDGLKYVVRNRAGYLSKILVKVEKQNEKYSIVSSYTTDELRELGLTDSEIYNVKTLSVYDEIVLEPDLSKVE